MHSERILIHSECIGVELIRFETVCESPETDLTNGIQNASVKVPLNVWILGVLWAY